MIRPSLLVSLLLLGFLVPVSGANRYWDGGTGNLTGNGNGVSAGGTGTWDTAIKNWDPANGSAYATWNNAANDTAVLGGTVGTITLGAAITAGSLTFNSAHTLANGGYNLTLSGSGISATAAATLSGTGSLIVASSQAWSNTTGTLAIACPVTTGANLLTLNTGTNNLDVTGRISGSGGLKVNSSVASGTNADTNGSPTLSNANDYLGTTTVSGWIWLNSGGLDALGGDASAILLSTGGFRLSGTGTVTRGLDLTGNCGVSKTSGTTTLSGKISGAGNLVISGSFGTATAVALAAANDFTGDTIIGPDGTARLADEDAFAKTTLTWNDNNGRSSYDFATANLACVVGGLKSVGNKSGNLNLGTGLANGGSGAVSFGANHRSNTYVGILSGAAGFTKVGTGIQTLIGANTYMGNTVVAAGTLKLGQFAGQSVAATTGTLTDKKLNVPSTTNLYIGQAVSGAGIGAGAVITGINSATQVLLSVNHTTAAMGTTAVFTDMIGSFAASPVVEVKAGAVLDGSGITGGLVIGGSQTLQGTGSVTGAVTSSGRVSPGAGGSGTLTLSQNFTQTAAGTLRFAPHSATGTPALVVSGTANLNGTLEVTLANGYVPLLNDTLAILRADTAINGGFTTIDLPGLPSGLDWTVLTTASAISLKVIAIPTWLSVTPTAHDFGGIQTSDSAQTTFVVTNTGATTLSGTAVVAGAPFTVVSGGSYSLGAGASANVVVEFAPTAVGAFSDALVFASSSGNATHPLSGAGIIPAVLGVSPASHDMGGVLHGTTAQATFVVTNAGGLPLTGTATVGAPFVVASGASYTVSPGGSAQVVVQFSAPATAGAVSDVVTFTSNGGNTSRMITAASLAGLPTVPADGTAPYSHNPLPGMPAVSVSTEKMLAPLGTIKQTFIPRSDPFLTAFNSQDGNGTHQFALNSLSLKLDAYQSTPATFRVAVSRVETGGARTLFFTQDFQQAVYGQTVRTWTFSEPVLLTCDVQYELAITLVHGGTNSYGGGEGSVGLYAAASDYPDGACSAGGDLWFNLAGTTALPIFSNLAFSSEPANAYFFDEDRHADSTSHDNLKAKFLAVNGHPEQLNFTCPPSWPTLTFALGNAGTATLQAQGGGGSYAVTLNGVAEGETFLFAKVGPTVVGYLALQSHPRRTIGLSYSYIKFPAENTNALMSYYAGVTSYISSLYEKVNVGINWTDNGVLTHEWDYNGDGSSYTSDYTEVWSPMTAGVIPNQNNFFSNLYLIRYNKDDNYQGGSNGGGTSSGFGATSVPPRGANVRAHLFGSAQQYGSTLAHELGHNLGLSHTGEGTAALDNLMDVGRSGDSLWSWQWQTIHATLKAVLPPAPPLVVTSTTPLPGGVVGVSYSYDFTAIGGTPGYLWTLASGSLPAGLTLTGNHLAGSPTTAAVFTFTMRVTDALAVAATASFTITVANPVYSYDQWAAAKGLTSSNHDKGQDPDGDGAANLMEYALDTDPLAAGACRLVQGVVADGGSRYLRLEAHKSQTATNLTYAVEVSASLAAASWTTAGTVVERNDAEAIIVRDGTPVDAATRRFIRLRVSSP